MIEQLPEVLFYIATFGLSDIVLSYLNIRNHMSLLLYYSIILLISILLHSWIYHSFYSL